MEASCFSPFSFTSLPRTHSSSSNHSAAMSKSNDAEELASSVLQLRVSAGAPAAAVEDEERDLSLPAHFYRCQARFTAICVTSKQPRTLAACTALQRSLTSLMARVESAGLFSANESGGADDLSTPTLKFMLVPYFLGQLEAGFPCDMASRITHVLAAARAFAAFMRRLDDYGLIQAEGEAETFKRYNAELIAKLTAAPAASSSSSSSSSRPPLPSSSAFATGPGGKRLDPNAVRTAKIARMRREKDLGAQLEILQQSRAQSFRVQTKAASSNTITSAGAAADGDDLEDELLDAGSDEADVRAFYLLLLQKCVFGVTDSTRSALEEAEILVHHRDVEARKPKHEQLAQVGADERARHAAGLGPSPSQGPKPVMYKMTPQSLNEPIPDHMKHLLQGIPHAAPPASASSSSSASAAASAPIPSSVSSHMNRLIEARMPSREQVFKLTNQPTYSIEQWADMEIAAGHMPGPNSNPQPRAIDPRRIRSAADRDTAEEMVAAFMATHEDSDELGHEDGAAGADKDQLKTLKDREWDNWKDDHQKGVGNTMK